jgi:hypothetical protein
MLNYYPWVKKYYNYYIVLFLIMLLFIVHLPNRSKL